MYKITVKTDNNKNSAEVIRANFWPAYHTLLCMAWKIQALMKPLKLPKKNHAKYALTTGRLLLKHRICQ